MIHADLMAGHPERIMRKGVMLDIAHLTGKSFLSHTSGIMLHGIHVSQCAALSTEALLKVPILNFKPGSLWYTAQIHT